MFGGDAWSGVDDFYQIPQRGLLAILQDGDVVGVSVPLQPAGQDDQHALRVLIDLREPLVESGEETPAVDLPFRGPRGHPQRHQLAGDACHRLGTHVPLHVVALHCPDGSADVRPAQMPEPDEAQRLRLLGGQVLLPDLP